MSIVRKSGLFAVCLLMALSLAACEADFGARGGGGSKDTSASDDPEIVIPVEVAQLTRGNIATYFETTTRVEAERKVDVSAKANSRCTSLHAEVGDRVEQGEILAELDKDESRALYSQLEVQVRQYETAYELAKRQYEEGLGPKAEMDNARYVYEHSLATLETQRIQLENLTIRAPIGGVVTAREIQEGMLCSSGQHVYQIVDPDSFIITISPPEKELPRLAVGQKAKVTIDSLRGREFDASIRRINPSVDPVSGTVKVVLDFDEDVREKLHESAFARVKLVMATLQNVLLAPKDALIEEDGRMFVFVARPDTEPSPDSTEEASAMVEETLETPVEEFPEPAYVAEQVEVRTGLEDDRRIQIFSGVTDEDLLITNGQHTLKPGTHVRITNLRDAILANAALSADEALAAAHERRAAGETAPSGKSR